MGTEMPFHSETQRRYFLSRDDDDLDFEATSRLGVAEYRGSAPGNWNGIAHWYSLEPAYIDENDEAVRNIVASWAVGPLGPEILIWAAQPDGEVAPHEESALHSIRAREGDTVSFIQALETFGSGYFIVARPLEEKTPEKTYHGRRLRRIELDPLE